MRPAAISTDVITADSAIINIDLTRSLDVTTVILGIDLGPMHANQSEWSLPEQLLDTKTKLL